MRIEMRYYRWLVALSPFGLLYIYGGVSFLSFYHFQILLFFHEPNQNDTKLAEIDRVT